MIEEKIQLDKLNYLHIKNKVVNLLKRNNYKNLINLS